MAKIKILQSFNTTHLGFLIKGSTVEVSDGFADYAVNRMKAAEAIAPETKKLAKPKKTK